MSPAILGLLGLTLFLPAVIFQHLSLEKLMIANKGIVENAIRRFYYLMGLGVFLGSIVPFVSILLFVLVDTPWVYKRLINQNSAFSIHLRHFIWSRILLALSAVLIVFYGSALSQALTDFQCTWLWESQGIDCPYR